MSEASLEKDAENRNKTAGKLKEIMGRPAGFIYTVQIATYLGGIITGAVLLGRFGLRPETFGAGAAALLAMVSFGAVIPKRCAVKHPERWAYMTYPLVRAVSILLKPFAWLAAGLSWAVLKCFGVELKRQEEDVTEEEIMLMVNEGQEKGVLEASEAEMITNIFELDNKQAGDIMTHRTAVKALDGDMTFKEAEQYVVNEAGNSRYPVYGEDIDDIIGILHIRDMLAVTLERGAECAGLPLREVRAFCARPILSPRPEAWTTSSARCSRRKSTCPLWWTSTGRLPGS